MQSSPPPPPTAQGCEDLKAKVVQLHDTMMMRPAVAIAGPTGTGKTVAWQTLRRTCAMCAAAPGESSPPAPPLHGDAAVHVLYPKVLSAAELYGSYSAEKEWVDGVLSALLRKVRKQRSSGETATMTALATETGTGTGSPQPTWIVFDGPLEPGWCDMLSTALDGHRLLSLANGERMRVPESVSVIYETEDLARASPGLVARCGVLMMGSQDVGAAWPRLALRLNRQLAKKHEGRWQAERVEELLEANVPSALAFVRMECREHVATTDMQLVESFLMLLGAFIENLDNNDDGPEKNKVCLCVGPTLYKCRAARHVQWYRRLFGMAKFGAEKI